MRPEDAMKIAGLPSDCVYCDYLEDGACTDEYCNRLCYPHLEGTEPKSNNQCGWRASRSSKQSIEVTKQ